MRRLAVLALVTAAAGLATAAPADATCMEWFDKFGIRSGSCSAPGGPVSSYTCVSVAGGEEICHWS